MGRPRKRHVQTDLVFNRRGGARPGAGRKPTGPRRKVPHRTRVDFSSRHPLFITQRVVDAVGHIRRPEVFRALGAAEISVMHRRDFRIVHTSIQGNHVHLVSEAESRKALTSGMTAFKTSAARRINKVLGRTGQVFADRYHVEVLDSVAKVRNALCYCLNNWRKHGADRGASSRVDPYSTGIYFPGWSEPDIPNPVVIPKWADILPSVPPRTWLLAEGWKKAKPISLFEVPGPKKKAA